MTAATVPNYALARPTVTPEDGPGFGRRLCGQFVGKVADRSIAVVAVDTKGVENAGKVVTSGPVLDLLDQLSEGGLVGLLAAAAVVRGLVVTLTISAGVRPVVGRAVAVVGVTVRG